MSDVLIYFGSNLLVLSRERFEEARQRGQELMPAQGATQPAEQPEILDAAGMEGRTGISASWWLEQARVNSIPHIRAGRYVRFDLKETLAALRSGDGTRTSNPRGRKKVPRTQPVVKPRYQRATTSGSTETDPRTLC